MSGRYNDFERRVFEHIIHRKIIMLGPGADIQLFNAIKDGLLFVFDVDLPLGKTQLTVNTDIGRFKLKNPPFPNQFLVGISPYGEAFVRALHNGDPLEEVDLSLPKDMVTGDNWMDFFDFHG